MLPEPALLGVFALASLAVILTPGPDRLYVMAHGLGQGRRAGRLSACRSFSPARRWSTIWCAIAARPISSISPGAA